MVIGGHADVRMGRTSTGVCRLPGNAELALVGDMATIGQAWPIVWLASVEVGTIRGVVNVNIGTIRVRRFLLYIEAISSCLGFRGRAEPMMSACHHHV